MTNPQHAPAPKLSGNRCQCSSCGDYFNSEFAFDRHRLGEHRNGQRRCLTAAEMIDKGFSRNAKGFWITRRATDLRTLEGIRKPRPFAYEARAELSGT